jgi:hypothetical protein
MTFVEEVYALAMAPDPAGAGLYRNLFRFGSEEARYEHRRHFFEAEWVPNAITLGLLRDITTEFGPAHTLQKDVELKTWQHWRRRKRFAFDDARFPVGPLEMPYLDLDAALAAVPRVPAGTLVVTLRIPVPHLPIVVTHVGLAVSGRVPLMRHSTHMSSRKVRDDRLDWYAEHLKSYDRWPVAGLRFLLPLEQGPRRIVDPMNEGSTPGVPPG